MSSWLSVADIAGLPGMPAYCSSINKLVNRENWRGQCNERGEALARRAGKSWFYHVSLLPGQAQAHLVAAQSADKTAPKKPTTEKLWDSFEGLSAATQARARKRLDILRAVKALEEGGLTRSRATKAVAKKTEASERGIWRWLDRVEGIPANDWLPHLASAHGGGRRRGACADEAWEFIKADYLRLSQPSFESCYQRLLLAAAEHGWQLPSNRALRRRLQKEVEQPVVTLKREGQDALKKLYPAQERRRDHLHALQAVNVDGHKWDVFVEWPGMKNPVRPMMVAVQDLYSNKILSWRLDVSENTNAVRLAFKDVFEHYGIPQHCFLDNGRAFASRQISGGSTTRFRFKVKEEEPQGLLTALGVEMHWTLPYSGQSKPIERAFRDLCDHVARHPAFEGAWTGNRPDAKPEDYASRAIPLDDFLSVVEEGIKQHNARTCRQTLVCAGEHSFDSAFNKSYAQNPVTKATEEQLRLCLLAAENVRAAKRDGAIKLLGNRYWSPCLHSFLGQLVTVRFDPDHLQAGVHAYSLSGTYVGFVECVKAAGFDNTEAARTHARERKQFINHVKKAAAVASPKDARHVAALLPRSKKAQPVDSKIVRLAHPTAPAAPKIQRPAPARRSLSADGEAAYQAFCAASEAQEKIVSLPALDPKKQRYARACALEERLASGQELDLDDAEWLKTYQGLAEYLSLRRMAKDFGEDWNSKVV